ncbi:MAG: DEAD/DEAH box helicase family protein [Candidatus Omnitrophica bacterium]|nr:DEAD/DEAH box helicase family protein [Candidatus Omnitrophota bacterium]
MLKKETNKIFPANIQFQKNWRPYQARVLSEIGKHLDDQCLHIIAAPGSGKTILGLEVMLRLGQPTLILAPTLAIREQWVDRFMEMFCPDSGLPFEISRDVRQPAVLTVLTYQSLHALYSRRDSDEEPEAEEVLTLAVKDQEGDRPAVERPWEDFCQRIRKLGINTIIIDEAHHLRNKWWQSLTALKRALDEPKCISLTATPPIDTRYEEWQRYKTLCGPVDSEISVPELVREKNLCPHQDFLYFSLPRPSERDAILNSRREIEQYVDFLTTHRNFISVIESHPLLCHPRKNIELILNDPAFFSSLIVFMSCARPQSYSVLLKILTGSAHSKIPPITLEWMEILLSGCFFTYKNDWGYAVSAFQEVEHDLRRMGVIEGRKVLLKQTKDMERLVSQSLSKLDSIANIVELEQESLGAALRLVILTDYIRKDDLPDGKDDVQPVHRMGVVPVFETLRRRGFKDIHLGILSGSLVIVPTKITADVKTICREEHMDETRIKITACHHDDQYSFFELGPGKTQRIVKVMTQLFVQGKITVLIGTKSLLGEGWDAPCVNTLILASFVGSFTLSNQMRGRAIRCLPDHPDKTANIWHLVCVEEEPAVVQNDWLLMKRRFQSFVGVGYNEPVIESGMQRFGLNDVLITEKEIQQWNTANRQRAINRSEMRQRWGEALLSGTDNSSLLDFVKSPSYRLPRNVTLMNTILAVFLQGLYLGGYFTTEMLKSYNPLDGADFHAVWKFFGIAFIFGFIVMLPYCVKSIILFCKHLPVSSSINQIAKIVLRTFSHMRLIKTPLTEVTMVSEVDRNGFIKCALTGATTYEQSLFLDAIEEIFNPVDNPRYFIECATSLLWLKRKDFFAVPNMISGNKQQSEYFVKEWNKHVGKCVLIYTRNLEGRQKLLHARSRSLSAAFIAKCERRREWR